MLSVVAAAAQSALTSPSGALEIAFTADGGQLAYTVNFRGKPVVLRSTLGLELAGQPVLGARVRVSHVTPGQGDETYTLLHGKASTVHSVYRSLALDLEETDAPHRNLQLEARAFDDGLAFRYVVPKQAGLDEIRLAAEHTTFRLAKDATTYPLLLDGFQTPYEDSYVTLPLSAIHPRELIGLPFLAELPGTAWVAITEANIESYAGMYLEHNSRDAFLLSSRLSPSLEQKDLAVAANAPLATPWRVLLIGAEPGRLVESNIVTSLNPPSAIADTSWIKPGKTAWDWWSGTWAEGVDFKPGMNTATMKHYIDFAAEHHLEYMLVDAGWYPAQDYTHALDILHHVPEVDIPDIIAYGKQKGVKVLLWLFWGALDKQMDEAMSLYEKWGAAGIKVDFMDHDDQEMVNFYERCVRKAAEHHLVVDLHGAYKPTGLRRTYPNLLTREGVMGMEYSKWSDRVTPEHDVTIPFTRMLAGPMDFTPGAFNNAARGHFVARNLEPMSQGTRAHQLAMYVVYQSPLVMLADYPEAYDHNPGMEFLDKVPTVWDDTKVLTGEPAKYITVARQHGDAWFLGSMTNWDARDLELPLDFLGKGQYEAQIFSDGPDADSVGTSLAISTKRVKPNDKLNVHLAPGGGWAAIFTPLP